MSQLLSRFRMRLLVPVLALTALAALGDPLPPAPAEALQVNIVLEREPPVQFAVALQQEAELIRQEAEAAKKAASRTAAQMRWFLTLPAAGNNARRCSAPTCAS
jgi:uncharacterized small protein (DUF1192 family)